MTFKMGYQPLLKASCYKIDTFKSLHTLERENVIIFSFPRERRIIIAYYYVFWYDTCSHFKNNDSVVKDCLWILQWEKILDPFFAL